MRELSTAVAVGFAIGLVAGFLFAQNTKAGISDAVTTRFDGARLIVELDTVGALAAGFRRGG